MALLSLMLMLMLASLVRTRLNTAVLRRWHHVTISLRLIFGIKRGFIRQNTTLGITELHGGLSSERREVTRTQGTSDRSNWWAVIGWNQSNAKRHTGLISFSGHFLVWITLLFRCYCKSKTHTHCLINAHSWIVCLVHETPRNFPYSVVRPPEVKIVIRMFFRW